jgi:hypothetical protein
MMVQDGLGWFRMVQDGSEWFRTVQGGSGWFRNLGKVRKRQRRIFVVQKEYSGGQLVCIAFLV